MTMELKNDNEIFAMMRNELYTAVIGDIMDQMGLLHQFLPPEIRPMREDMVLAGRAMTVLEADVETLSEKEKQKVSGHAFGLMLEALDSLKENEIYICTGSSPSYAVLGELMTMRAKYLRAAGAVLDGYIRDTRGIRALGLPVFSLGSYAQDQAPRGVVIGYRIPIQLGKVTIHSGDILFGDIDGVLVIPQKQEKEILRRAYEKATGEKIVGHAIQNGMSAQDAFRKYGIM